MCGAVFRDNVRIAGITHQLSIFKRGGCNLAVSTFFTHKSGGTEIDVADLLGELRVLTGSECTRIGRVINGTGIFLASKRFTQLSGCPSGLSILGFRRNQVGDGGVDRTLILHRNRIHSCGITHGFKIQDTVRSNFKRGTGCCKGERTDFRLAFIGELAVLVACF